VADGTYDPQLNLLYWGVGNRSRLGRREPPGKLYTGSLGADPTPEPEVLTYTPHDTTGRERNSGAGRHHGQRTRKVVMMATATVLLRERSSHGRVHPREAVRDDDVVGEIGRDGRPVLNPDRADRSRTPSRVLTTAAPTSVSSFDAKRNLFFVTARETCKYQPSACGHHHGRDADARRQRVSRVGTGQVLGRAARARRVDGREEVGDRL
jgi:hypothetical protein